MINIDQDNNRAFIGDVEVTLEYSGGKYRIECSLNDLVSLDWEDFSLPLFLTVNAESYFSFPNSIFNLSANKNGLFFEISAGETEGLWDAGKGISNIALQRIFLELVDKESTDIKYKCEQPDDFLYFSFTLKAEQHLGVRVYHLVYIYLHKLNELLKKAEAEIIRFLDAIGTGELIDRAIEFSPENYQAGIGILNYFSEILKAKCPEQKASVRIEQDPEGHKVRLTIVAENGDKEIIEKTFKDYIMVVTDNAPPESLLTDPVELVALKGKLRIAEAEIENARDKLMLMQNISHSQAEDIKFLKQTLTQALCHQQELVEQASESNKKLIDCVTIQSQKTLDVLIQRSDLSVAVNQALVAIQKKLEQGVSEADKAQTKEELNTIVKNSPEIIPELSEALKNTMYGVSGNLVFQWLQLVTTALT